MQRNGIHPSGSTKVSPFELARILRVFWIGLALRCGLVLTLQATGVERSLKLTKDAFLYDSVGKQIAEHYQTNGGTSWPDRVSGVLDHLYEHFVGLTYYFTDDSMLAVRLVNVLAGCLVILQRGEWLGTSPTQTPPIAVDCGRAFFRRSFTTRACRCGMHKAHWQ